jgi:hypothetical protein
MVRVLDQQVPRYCQHLDILSILGDIVVFDYGLDDGD